MNRLKEISFLFPIIIVFLGGIGFLIKHYFFNNKNNAPFITAGGNITAGGDVIVGNKAIADTDAKNEPDLHISQTKKHDNSYAEIYNTGMEDVSNLKVKINWLQKGNLQSRDMSQYFFNENEDPVFNSSHLCQFLRKGEKKIISSLPRFSDNGEIIFIVSGQGARSKKNIEKNIVINNTKYIEG